MSRLHCHAQIEYTALGKQYGFDEVVENQVETLTGFDPRTIKDREFIHSLLDEYLDYLSRRMDDANEKGLTIFEPKYEDNWFKVFDNADTH
jgi:hypothetical protein